MNRLILVGNGFDLAHNLKTTYCDFIKNYIKFLINNFIKNDSYEDVLIKISYEYPIKLFQNNVEINSENAITFLKSLRVGSYSNHINVKVKSIFFEKSLLKLENIKWVDLEDDYFNELLACKIQMDFDFEKVKKLNNEFDFLRKELEKYLIKVQKENEQPFSIEISNLFCEKIKGGDIVTLTMIDQNPKKL